MNNRNTNIKKCPLHINTQLEKKVEEEEDEEEEDKRDITIFKSHNCSKMVSIISCSNLKNGVDFLLVSENDKQIRLKNNKWRNYNFGVYLVGKNITLTVHCDETINRKEFGHLKIKASHLWIKHSSSTIDCSELGYPSDQGPGKGESGECNGHSGGGGYGTKGGYNFKKGGTTYGEETLQKEICFGSGGGRGIKHKDDYGGSGGGIIELIIEHQLLNRGSIRSNGGDSCMKGGGGSGGSILIKLQQSLFSHDFGTIQCIGGEYGEVNKGGKGRIAIYGQKLQPDDIKKINPKPFNSINK
ncbi:hypothetical protein RFI_28869 [Reticulomyxa filosa]|uniref:Uncharacterized protein n=1 Tax=Reticulomyxa filosa TaxID=46433 RepID=X6M4X8_RETFI|nr:hypothetical protein RFI_28869 [Reticulomyxa filosa]|eukprot:ETO08517.1 hypothetical protein RFI_28869 [Reticulomyxa filosa]